MGNFICPNNENKSLSIDKKGDKKRSKKWNKKVREELKMFKEYEFGEELGKGRQGAVYKAQKNAVEGDLAIKIINKKKLDKVEKTLLN